jgi:hypothetical protein
MPPVSAIHGWGPLRSAAQCIGRGEQRRGGAGEKSVRTQVSVLHCIDAIMQKSADVFEAPLRRSGLVGKVECMSCKGVGAPPGAELQQDLALYLVDKYFGGSDGARALPASGEVVREGLARLSAVLDRLAAERSGGDERAVLAASAQALAAIKELAALFKHGLSPFLFALVRTTYAPDGFARRSAHGMLRGRRGVLRGADPVWAGGVAARVARRAEL